MFLWALSGSFCNSLKLLPHLDHSIGIQLAVLQQIVPGLCLFLRGHELNFGEDVHGLAAIVNAF